MAKGSVEPFFGGVISEVVADFQPGFAQIVKLPPSSNSVLGRRQNDSAGALSSPLLRQLMPCTASLRATKRLKLMAPLATLVGMNYQPLCRLAYGQGPAQGFADKVFGHGFAHVPAHDFTRVVGQPNGPTALFKQIRDVAHPDLMRGGLIGPASGSGPRAAWGRSWWHGTRTNGAAGRADLRRLLRGVNQWQRLREHQ